MFNGRANVGRGNPQTHGIKRRQLFFECSEHKRQVGSRRRGEAIVRQCYISHMKQPPHARGAGGRPCAAWALSKMNQPAFPT